MTRDSLAKSLKVSFGQIIKEADEWRPLADHILQLINLEQKNYLILEFDDYHEVYLNFISKGWKCVEIKRNSKLFYRRPTKYYALIYRGKKPSRKQLEEEMKDV